VPQLPESMFRSSMTEPENGGNGAGNMLREICQFLYEVSAGSTLVLTISDLPNRVKSLKTHG
jgi:hypothetical protein